jgi:hypothetical protein
MSIIIFKIDTVSPLGHLFQLEFYHASSSSGTTGDPWILKSVLIHHTYLCDMYPT